MLVKQQQSIDNLTAAVLRQTTTSSANLSPPHTISTPIIRRQELTCTSSTTSRQLQFPDTPSSSNALNTTSSPIVATCSPHPRMDPVRRSFGPLPMHLFTDIDEQYRISENDLNIAVYSTNTAGNFATHLLRIIFAELFTSDNLRVYYSYFGGGKLKKRPLDDQRKSAIRRYVIAFYPDVNSDNTYTMQVVTKINECLRRPI